MKYYLLTFNENWADEHDVPALACFNEEQYQKALPLIKTQLKALIARDLWDMTEYFRVMNTTNESVQKALEILNSDEYGKKLK